MTEPSNAEVMRRLDEVARQLLGLAGELREDRRQAAATYVRKDVYDAEHREHTRRITGLESEADAKEKADDQFRRQIAVAVIGVALPALGAFVLALNTILNGVSS